MKNDQVSISSTTGLPPKCLMAQEQAPGKRHLRTSFLSMSNPRGGSSMLMTYNKDNDMASIVKLNKLAFMQQFHFGVFSLM
ncbi:hypothetical protein QZH41_014325 [Actinostola sp. cb2023]|nr:hypothetical protein QZH41_014325 [Actinostola sp. cb2023]